MNTKAQQPVQNKFSPIRITVLSFLALILFGTVLLMLPFSTAGANTAGLIDAFFTAVSAVCVTGLIVQDTATFFSRFGQGVILILIQLGGLGIMSLYAALPVIFGAQLRLSQRRMFSAIFEADNYTSLKQTIRAIVKYTFIIESLGAIILSLRFYYLLDDLKKAIFYGVFHSVSAFCNAGFALFSDSLIQFSGDWIINIVISSLYILGGLGFVVLFQLIHRRSFKKLSANSKLAVVSTLVLIIVPSIIVFHFEFNNAFVGRGIGEKTLLTFLQVTSTRTAGFNSIDLNLFSNATLFLFCILMFVGASPGGSGGGVKTTTAGLMFLSIRSIFKGQPDIECFGRRVPRDVVTRSVAIIAIGFSIVTVFIIALMMIEEASFVHVFFEVISAFSTVGLSLGLTPELTDWGKFLISIVMFVGRIGTLSLIFLIGAEDKSPSYQFPLGKFMVG
ncbi:MAG: Trk family potassium uptake protein [Deltaproteobacteria bacterium]|nr:Trk family potassium uptake protein [Deltaproteobacteria bacterium]